MKSSYLGPYSNLPVHQTGKLVGIVSQADKQFFRSIDPSVGGMDYFVTTIFHAFVQKLKADGITYYSPDNVTHLRSLIRNCAAACATCPGPNQDGPATTPSVHTTNQGTSDVASYIRQSPEKRVRSGGTGRGKVGKKAHQIGQVGGE